LEERVEVEFMTRETWLLTIVKECLSSLSRHSLLLPLISPLTRTEKIDFKKKSTKQRKKQEWQKKKQE